MTTPPGTLLCVSLCYAAVAIAATFGNLYGIIKISVMCKVCSFISFYPICWFLLQTPSFL